MKILFLSIVPSPYQRDFFAALNDRDEVDIHVLYAAAGIPDSPWPREELCSYEEVTPSFNLSWRGKRFIVNSQLPSISGYDAIVLNGYATIPAQWILRTAGKKRPVVFWGEKMEHGQGGAREFFQNILTKPMKNLSAVVAIGKKAARDYRKLFPELPIYEVPYYCSLSHFQNAVPARPRQPVNILFCGQMIYRKGVDLLLEAFTRLIESGLEARLTLVGWEQKLPEMLSEVPEKVLANINAVGFKTTGELPMYFAEADIFVLPSRYDGWGVVVNQALGAGLPVVCSDAVGSAEDLVDSGKNGFVFPNGDVRELEKSLAALVTEPNLLGRFAEKSLEKSHNITPEQGARDWVKIFSEICH